MQKNSAIEEIFLKNSKLMESIKPTEEYFQILKEYIGIFREFKKSLSEKQIDTIDQLELLSDRMFLMSVDQHFTEALKLGFRLAVELL